MSLAGKVALITGGSSGIGLETAKVFAAEGAKVCVAARREPELKKAVEDITAAGGEAMYVKTDVTDAAAIKAMVAACVEKFGRLDILFNNAGWEGPTFFPEPTGLGSVDDETCKKINDINMTAPLLVAKAALPEMQKNGEEGGIIIGNSSVAAVIGMQFAHTLPIYHPTKGYMDALTRMLAAAHGPAVGGHIKAYNVNPGPVMTDMWTNIYDDVPEYAKPALAEMGVTSPETYSGAFAMLMGDPAVAGADGVMPLIYGKDIAAVALHMANGTTQYAPGDGALILAGATYHNYDFYPIIYGGFDMTTGKPAGLPDNYLKARMRDQVGNLKYPEAGDNPPGSTVTVTTTTTLKDGTTTVNTVTTTVE